MLHCISSYFNPTNSKKIKENYLTFRKNLKVPITTVELAFNDQPFFISDSIKIRGDTNNIMWQKERLLNIAIDSLPNNIDKIAWIDADILFENEKWFYDTEKELDDYEARQLKFEAELISLAEKQQAKNALLEKLGITADEAKLLLS